MVGLSSLLQSCVYFYVLPYWLQPVNAQACPPFNPPLPLSQPLTGSPALSKAVQSLNTSIAAALQEGTVLDNLNTSFSIDIYSLNDEAPLFTYHFSAPGLSNASEGVNKVDSNTIYRLGSISKVFTVYTFLAKVGDASWNQPITKWDDVTIGALASQLSGMARDPAPSSESDKQLAAEAGLPPVPHVNGSYCTSGGIPFPCDRKASFTNLLEQHPIMPPHHSPVYTNFAYALLAFALENMAHGSFPDLMQSTILSPLHLTSTYYPLPPPAAKSHAVIPFNDRIAWYSTDLHVDNPGGGVYSTINDMRALGKSILASTLLSPALTRRWLKPHSFTPDTYMCVGAPWEITSYPPSSRFPVRIYGKSGDVGAYSTQMGLLEDYHVGFTVLTAGAQSSRTTSALSDLVAAALVPGVKAAAVEQANVTYAGVYKGEEAKVGNTSIAFSVVDDGGDVGSVLKLDSFVFNGTDMLDLIGLALGATQGYSFEVALFPTGLKQVKEKEVIESWRAVFARRPKDDSASKLGPYSGACWAWGSIDSAALMYGGVEADEVLFARQGGSVTGVELRFLRLGFWSKEAGGIV